MSIFVKEKFAEAFGSEAKVSRAAIGVNCLQLHANLPEVEPADARVNRDLNELIQAYGSGAIAKAFFKSEAGDAHCVELNSGAAARALSAAIREIVYSNNPLLSAEIFAAATGLFIAEGSLSEIAKKHGVSRMNVSQRIQEIIREFGLPPSVFGSATPFAETRQGRHLNFCADLTVIDRADKWSMTRLKAPSQLEPRQARSLQRRFWCLREFLAAIDRAACNGTREKLNA